MDGDRVHEVAACGFTDAAGIERMAAFVVPGAVPDDADRLADDLKTRVRHALGESKVPAVILVIAEMPRLSREKIDKQALIRGYLATC
jgi:acyl-CoA synthetase (AMP-forming)/AMP-acid ligase II